MFFQRERSIKLGAEAFVLDGIARKRQHQADRKMLGVAGDKRAVVVEKPLQQPLGDGNLTVVKYHKTNILHRHCPDVFPGNGILSRRGKNQLVKLQRQIGRCPEIQCTLYHSYSPTFTIRPV